MRQGFQLFDTGMRVVFGCSGFLIAKMKARIRGAVGAAPRPELVQACPIAAVLMDLAGLDILASMGMLEADVQVIAGPMANITFSQTARTQIQTLMESSY